MYKDRNTLIARIEAQISYETRWLRRIPLLLGILAAVVACYGYFMSY